MVRFELALSTRGVQEASTLRPNESNRRAVWTEQRLSRWVKAFLGDARVIVLANREPFMHQHGADGIVATRSASGLVTALEPIMQACGGVWVAHGSGNADRAVVDRRDGVGLPPENPRYRLRRVWLTPREQRGYYSGFANEALWPLCHRTQVRPVFREDDFEAYRTVNAKFTDAVCDEAASASPVVLVQDYHFALAPENIRRRLPQSTIAAFWHIPWPDPRDLNLCPWGDRMLNGLLGSDIVGFQTPTDCEHFIACAAALLDVHIDRARLAIVHSGGETLVRAFPVSIEWPSRWARQSPPVDTCRLAVRRDLHLQSDVTLGVGVDRMDYTKGIEEKFLAIERFLELRPDLAKCFAFAQIAEPSRTALPAYRDLRGRLRTTADRINARFATPTHDPILLLEAHHDLDAVFRFLRAADFCFVASLHDGMNLVAKEFVAARDDNRGVLVLSSFAGSAQQLDQALVVDPYATDDCARAVVRAVTMTAEEQSRRMRIMRASVAERSTYWWAGQLLEEVTRVRRSKRAAHGRLNARLSA